MQGNINPVPIVEHRFESAVEFLRELDAVNPRWMVDSVSPSPWIFRGQADADWHLDPRAWRASPEMDALRRRFEPSLEGRGPRHRDLPLLDTGNKLESLERAIVREWVRIANDAGHSIRVGEGDCDGGIPTEFDEPHLDSPLVALAQHAGLPTRMLDFTTDPRIAAFFAAERDDESASHLAVWALRRDLVRPGSGVVVHDFIRADNPHLHAQRGILLGMESSGLGRTMEAYGGLPHLDSIAGGPRLKFTLPRSERDTLLASLESARVTRAHLFPHYAAVTASMEATTARLARGRPD